MKKEQFEEVIKKYVDSFNDIYGFYVSYKGTKNVTSNKWGSMEKLSDVLDKIGESEECVQGELPIEKLIVYSGDVYRAQCLVFAKNELYDPLRMDSNQSHTVLTVPFIASDGWFGHIESDRNIQSRRKMM